MPSINMIAARRAEKKKLETRVRVMVLVTLGELAIMLGLFSFMTARMFAADISLNRLDNDLKKLKPTVTQINAYEHQIDGLKPRLNLLSDSRESAVLWSNILEDLSHSMPEKTWLSSLATVITVDNGPASEKKEPPKVSLTLHGTSQSQQLVGESMLKLGETPEFDRVDLNFTQKGAMPGLDTVEFDLTAVLKPSAPEKKGT